MLFSKIKRQSRGESFFATHLWWATFKISCAVIFINKTQIIFEKLNQTLQFQSQRGFAFWLKFGITHPKELLFHNKLFLAISIDFREQYNEEEFWRINFNGILFFHFQIPLTIAIISFTFWKSTYFNNQSINQSNIIYHIFHCL